MKFYLAKSIRLILPLLVIVLAVVLVLLQGVERVAASACRVSGPASHAYAVTLCIANPRGSATLTGASPVAASLDVTGTNPGIAQITYSLDGQYLLTSHSQPYTFVLPTDHFADGAHTLQALAVMADGFALQPVQVQVVFKNGLAHTPEAPAFKPSTGLPPSPGKPFLVAATGDGATGQATESEVADLVGAWNPNLFLYLGDVYAGGSAVEFYNWHAPSSFFGRFRAITDPTVGDQEHASPQSPTGYFDYWGNPPHYYSVDVAGWHLISLDSTAQFNETDAGSAQYQWLAKNLEANKALCTIAYFHDPVFDLGSGTDADRLKGLWTLLAQHGVDLVLTGGNHNYQRWVPLDQAGNPSQYGTTELVVGTGGSSVQAFARSDSRLAAGFDAAPKAYGALRLQLNPHGAAFEYVDVQDQVLDSGVVACSHAPEDTTPPSVPTGLTATAVSGNEVDLTWNESTDDSGVAGYTIYRDGKAIATVNGTTLTFKDMNAVSRTRYQYTVDAFDEAENHSDMSAPASLTTPGALTLTFAPAADAYVSEAHPNENYGTAQVLRADASPTVRSYLRFDVEGLTGAVTQATLRIYAESDSAGGYTVAAVAGSAWDERTITYENAPGLTAPGPESSGPFKANNWTTVDVTPLVKGNGPVSLAIVAASNTAIRLASRESGMAAPQLIVQSGAGAAASGPLTQSGTPPAAPETATALPTATATATPTGTLYSLIPVADAYVSSDNPLVNRGSAKVLRVDLSPEVHSYLRFNVVGLQAPVVHATLRVYANSNSKTGFEVHAVTDVQWSEKAINFMNAPPYAPAIAAASGPLTADAWTDVDVTSLVTGNGAYSLALVGVGPTALSLASRETGPHSPQLIIETHP